MTTLSTAELNALATKLGTDATFAALFTTDPGLSGTVVGELSGGSPTYARQALSWSSASGGVITATASFNIPASTTVAFGGICTANSGNTLIGRAAVTTFSTGGSQVVYVLTLTFTQT